MFDLVHQHLYFIQNTALIHTDLNKSRRLNRVSKIHYPHGNTTCKFICDPLIKSEDFCYCVDEVKTYKEYICSMYNAKCLNKLCVGFKCGNGKCRRNNVRCNMIDDCGDSSDESNCTDFCPKNKHLCKGKCISKAIICSDLSYKYPKTRKEGVVRQISEMEGFYDTLELEL
ncbi:Suppressor of tumorigenicity 14 protein [Thelohanellus kitauei]|uniref:Suppressor of tumorigenicity 14 protein n=1 Tax=Thelohanellus kitauei TaxID=669202 RepID=A0A0C2M6A6_THEKT|nr:Suppressor of tumorigenicity 14 protein [Thelohanellus kitauei]